MAATLKQRPMPPSLWAATAIPAPPTPALDATLTSDVAIVGAGYTGLTAALHLVERGVSVAVLDAGEPGWGASGRNGGQVIPGLKYDPDELERMFGPERGPRLAEFAGKSADLVFDLIDKHKIACDPVRTGWLQPAHSPTGKINADRRAELWMKRGADVALLDRAAMADMLGSEHYCGGWIDRRAGNIQPLSFARGLASAAIAQGVAVHGSTPAQTLRREDGKWRIEVPGGASVLADQVLLATNGYTDNLWPGLEREVISTNSYQAATRPLPASIRAGILKGGQAASDTRRVLLYYRLDRDGRFIIGGRGTATDEPSPALFEKLRQSARAIYPQLAEVEWGNHWSGRVCFTTDHLPHLIELAPGLTAALGYQGRGVAMATNLGRIASAYIMGTPAEALPLPVATKLNPFPCHFLRVPALYAATRWYRLMDLVN